MALMRKCARPQCEQGAVSTMTYNYRDAVAVVGPLSPTPKAGALDFCMYHAQTVTVPVGWELIRLVTNYEPVPPSADDLTALADAIREASQKEVPPPAPARREVNRPATDINSAPRPSLQVPVRPRLAIIDGGATDSLNSAD